MTPTEQESPAPSDVPHLFVVYPAIAKFPVIVCDVIDSVVGRLFVIFTVCVALVPTVMAANVKRVGERVIGDVPFPKRLMDSGLLVAELAI